MSIPPSPARLPRLAALLLLAAAAGTRAADPARTTLNFDADWRFFKGDIGNGSSPPATTPPGASSASPTTGPSKAPFDQAAPPPVPVPASPPASPGIAKPSPCPRSQGQKSLLEFDGIMANSEVYINNASLGKRPNGYVGLRYDLSDYVSPTGPNILAIRTDTSRQPASRWYTGAGIYRHVRLFIENRFILLRGPRLFPRPR